MTVDHLECLEVVACGGTEEHLVAVPIVPPALTRVAKYRTSNALECHLLLPTSTETLKVVADRDCKDERAGK